jgi:dienelactone hydrolase
LRPLEMVLVSLLFIAVLWAIFRGRRGQPVFYVLCALAAVVLAMHMIFEGAHWQMIPAYLALLLAALFVIPPMRARRPRVAIMAAMLLLTALTCGLSAVLPMFRLPRPTGPYAVGTRIDYLVDTSRLEDAAGHDHQPRELMIQIWYPAKPSNNPIAPYRRRRETTLLSSYTAVLPTNSHWNAPVADALQAFPILLFNPAWNGRRTQNTYLTEELASHGFVVAAIDHTYNSYPIAFPDGRVTGAASVPEMENVSKTTVDRLDAVLGREVEKQAQDDIFVLNRLDAWDHDRSSPFFQRLDANNAGALGHSLGGSVAALACALDPRIKSTFDMSGPFYGRIENLGLSKPFLLVDEGVAPHTRQQLERLPPDQLTDAEEDQEYLDQMNASLKTYGGYWIVLHGANHASFTDHILTSPIGAWSGAGAIPNDEILKFLRDYAVAFFELTLHHQSSPLLGDEKSPYPFATYTRYVPARKYAVANVSSFENGSPKSGEFGASGAAPAKSRR